MVQNLTRWALGRRRSVGSRWSLLVLGLLCLALTPSTPAFAQYRLQIGDTVAASIVDVPGSEARATVDLDGMINLERLGSFTAAGLTLSELQEAVSLSAAGQVVAFYTAAGDRLQVALDGTEVFVEILTYRPVYLQGDVGRPGRLEFEPGMTVRTALASAGGPASVPVLFEDAALATPRLQSDFQTLALTHAGALVRLWAIDALMALQGDQAAPAPAMGLVAPPVFDRLVALERARVGVQIEAYREGRRSLEERVAFLESRVELLSESLANQEAALALEEEDVARVRELQERGLAAAARLSDARQALLLVASRVLAVQDSLAQFTLQLQQLRQELAAYDQTFRRPLLSERAEVRQRLWQTEAELAGTRKTLELNGQAAAAFGLASDPLVNATIVRAQSGGSRIEAAMLDERLLPGDVVEVRVRHAYPQFMGEVAGGLSGDGSGGGGGGGGGEGAPAAQGVGATTLARDDSSNIGEPRLDNAARGQCLTADKRFALDAPSEPAECFAGSAPSPLVIPAGKPIRPSDASNEGEG